MIGLLDPALLLQRGGPNPSKTFRDEIDPIITACRSRNIRLLPIGSYWNDLWSNLGRPLEATLDSSARRALQELRKLGSHTGPFQAPSQVVAWRRGFRQLFEAISGENWEMRMASAVATAASLNDSIIMFVRRIEGRNLVLHQVQNSTLEENTRWALYIQMPGIGPRQIICAYNPRNLTDIWTCRYDWRLPGQTSSARYPFIPADNWWKGSTVALKSVQSKLCWLDRNENGWARPNIPQGAGYHWDVFIHSPHTQQRLGSNHINVVSFGVPLRQGLEGCIHHIDKQSRSRINDLGWA